jgi:hypothetical protein
MKGGDYRGVRRKQIKNVYDYTYVLGECKPGEVVEIVVLRANEREATSHAGGTEVIRCLTDRVLCVTPSQYGAAAFRHSDFGILFVIRA